MEEYYKYFESREKYYSKICDDCLILPEGLDVVTSFERAFFDNQMDLAGASLSLLPQNFKSREVLTSF